MRILILALFLFASAVYAQLPAYSSGNYPVFQTATSDTEAQFNAILPRLKNYEMRAYPIDAQGVEGPMIPSSTLMARDQDQSGQLHDKVMRFQFKNLNPAIKYRLEIVEVSKFGTKPVEQRYFKTMDQTPRALNFATISCMCDEKEYEEPRQVLWKKVKDAKLDAIFLLGDMTYVDSFNFVERGKATDLDIWMRTINSAKSLPLGYFETLIPIQFTWDDHDVGVDNGNRDFPLIASSRRATQSIYGGNSIPGIIENGEGVNTYIRWAGQHFIMMDGRSWRGSHNDNSLYAHFGEAQEKWLFNILAQIKDSGPVHLMAGDMWGSELIEKRAADGQQKRLTESFFGDHPVNYIHFMTKLQASGVTYVLHSGDIHFSQVIMMGPQEKGTSRYNPFNTYEITSSPIHSIIFKTQNEPLFWKDGQRVVAYKDYNFVIVNSAWNAANKSLKMQVQSIGMQDRPLFQLSADVKRQTDFKSDRQRILAKGFDRNGKKVKVAFFDADATLRVAPSGKPTAQNSNDVYILPNVANKIAELNAQGYLIAIVSNQGGLSYAGLGNEKDADGALRNTISQIQAQNPQAKIHYYDYAASNDKEDFFRKPNPGMGLTLERVLARMGYELDWANSFMVGDAHYKKTDVDPRTGKPGEDFTNTDRLFAENLKIKSVHPHDLFGWSPDQLMAVRKNDIQSLNNGVSKAISCKSL